MENYLPPKIVLFGDEDAAAMWVPFAKSMAAHGVSAMSPDSVTDIQIVRNGPECTIYIHTHMEVPYHVMVPKAAPQYGDSAYFIYLLGYAHRKEAITPAGLNLTQVEVLPGESQYGNEVHYISDGMAVLSSGITDQETIYQWQPEDFTTVMSINGAIMEDALYAKTQAGNPGGFLTDRHYVSMSRIVGMGGAIHHTITPHGVQRTNPLHPTYAAVCGHIYTDSYALRYQDHTGATQTDPALADVLYRSVNHVLTYITEGATSSFSTYLLGEDFFDIAFANSPLSTTESGDWSAITPIVWNVGNLTSIVLYRNRIANPAKVYGGTFGLVAKRISGIPPLPYAATCADLTSAAYHSFPTFSFHATDYPNPPTDYGFVVSNGVFFSWDQERVAVLLHTLAKDARNQCPVSQTETLTFGQRIHMNQVPNNLTTHDAEIWCFSVTSAGVAQKSFVYAYWSEYCEVADLPANTPRRSCGFFRTVVVAPNTVVFIFRRSISYNYGPWLLDGYFRKVSTDGGTTWGAEEKLNFSGVSQNWNWSLPKVVRLGTTSENAVLVAGYIEVEYGATSKVFKRGGVLQSEDGGLNWHMTGTAAPDLDYTADLSYVFTNGDSGVGSVHNHGCYEDGYEPSPFKHLPNYYGTARPICRDSAVDPNL